MEKVIEERSIKYLFHFTRVENLHSIIERGLLTRSYLENHNVPFSFNDKERLDAHLESVSCSISFPNYKMFYRLKKRNPEVSWALILLDSKILIEKPCAFFHTNAARNDVRQYDIEKMKAQGALESLFKEFDDWFKIADPRMFSFEERIRGGELVTEPKRSPKIPCNYTTDPQAEVLVLDAIEPEYIKYILFNRNDITLYEEYSEKYPHIEFRPNKCFFTYREDWENWKKDQYGY